MKRKVLIVYNPTAGKGKSKVGLLQAQEALAARNIDFDVFETEEGFNHNREALINYTHKDFTEIWIVGGDGTLHQLLNTMPIELWKLSVAIIPAGTGNDFVKNYLPDDSIDCGIATALGGIAKPVDVWQCNDKLFIHGLGIGFDGLVVESMMKRKTILKGFALYYYHVLRLLLSYTEKKFKLDSNETTINFRCFMITVGNSHTFGGGFKITPKAKIHDGLLDVCAISAVPVWQRPRYLKSVEKGEHLHLTFVNYSQTEKLTIQTLQTAAGHIDGELFYGKEFTISKHSKPLNIILP